MSAVLGKARYVMLGSRIDRRGSRGSKGLRPGEGGLEGRKGNEIVGPYLPLIIEACAEEQLSYEYRHSVTSHGAFTYCLSRILREQQRISFEKLVSRVREDLAYLQYDRTPQILGPSKIVKARAPWAPAGPPKQ